MHLFPGVAHRFTWLLLAAAAVKAPVALADEPADTRVENAVVRVFSTVVAPDPFKPWTRLAPREITGSGVVIEGRRILTNAHMVSYASQVQVQASHAGDKLPARVKAIAPGIDLAVLELEDPKFFDTHPPLERASTLPSARDAVLAYGFPTGGTSLSITKGIVSRIEFATYRWPVGGLRIQIDAAVNPGNSGGPAMVGDKMIGLVSSHLGKAQNIGYIVPEEEIALFLDDIADGRYDGKPTLFLDLQTLENEGLRSFLKLERSVQGMMVTRLEPGDTGRALKPWDVITSIGGASIDDQGRVEIQGGHRVWFRYLVQKMVKDGKVPLTIWRDGKELSVQVPVLSTNPLLIRDLQGSYPRYFVYGPLAFSAATVEFVNALTSGEHSRLPGLSFSGSPLVSRMGERPAFTGEELVVVSSPFFPHRLAQGYSNPFAHVVKAVNGTSIKNLQHLVEVLRDLHDEFVTFEIAGRGEDNLVFPRKEMMDSTEGILTEQGIRAQGSPDTMAVWNAKSASRTR